MTATRTPPPILLSIVLSVASGAGLARASEAPLFAVQNQGGGSFLARIGPSDASVTVVSGLPFGADALVFTPDGRLLIPDNTNHVLREFDPQTGSEVQTVGSLGASNVIEALSCHPIDGGLWGVEAFSRQLVRIDPGTGAVTAVGTTNPYTGVAGLSWSVDGSTLYGVDCWTGDLVTLDPVTAKTTPVGATGLTCPLGLSTDPKTGRLYTVDWLGNGPMNLHTLSTADGSAVLVGATAGADKLEGLAFDPRVGWYGDGCPGTGRFVPIVRAVPQSPAASTQVAVTVDDALGGASCHLFFGLGSGEVPMGLGCSLLVAPLLPVAPVLPLGGAGPGQGSLQLVGIVPASAAGAKFTLQAFVVDPGAPLGFANSNGFRIDVQ
ncbi:MAG: DUF6923 family protein [Planctomycetota bacterium JB042]